MFTQKIATKCIAWAFGLMLTGMVSASVEAQASTIDLFTGQTGQGDLLQRKFFTTLDELTSPGAFDNSAWSFNQGERAEIGNNVFVSKTLYTIANATLNLASDAHYLGFEAKDIFDNLDDIPTKGTIDFFEGSTLVDSFSVTQLKDALMNGASAFANFTSSAAFNKVVFEMAMNIDNIHASTEAVSPVPLPAALPLFGAAIGGVGLFGRKRRTRRSIA